MYVVTDGVRLKLWCMFWSKYCYFQNIDKWHKNLILIYALHLLFNAQLLCRTASVSPNYKVQIIILTLL